MPNQYNVNQIITARYGILGNFQNTFPELNRRLLEDETTVLTQKEVVISPHYSGKPNPQDLYKIYLLHYLKRESHISPQNLYKFSFIWEQNNPPADWQSPKWEFPSEEEWIDFIIKKELSYYFLKTRELIQKYFICLARIRVEIAADPEEPSYEQIFFRLFYETSPQIVFEQWVSFLSEFSKIPFEKRQFLSTELKS
ncbi:MAG: hypothetical protein HY920_01290, partial [Elusimicrobia bacterium]|nr:hypothetical protein [Elusimicrobiota bacterium]